MSLAIDRKFLALNRSYRPQSLTPQTSKPQIRDAFTLPKLAAACAECMKPPHSFALPRDLGLACNNVGVKSTLMSQGLNQGNGIPPGRSKI